MVSIILGAVGLPLEGVAVILAVDRVLDMFRTAPSQPEDHDGTTTASAGGETSGAVAARLGLRRLRFGPEIDPGVPWTFSIGEPTLALALKSGNFGTSDFFTKAFEKL